jgi:hypothetical protein
MNGCNHVHLIYIENMSSERIKVYECSDCLNLFDVELKPLGNDFIKVQKGTKGL